MPITAIVQVIRRTLGTVTVHRGPAGPAGGAADIATQITGATARPPDGTETAGVVVAGTLGKMTLTAIKTWILSGLQIAWGSVTGKPSAFAPSAHAAAHAPDGADSLLPWYAPGALEITSGEINIYPYEYTISGTTQAVPNLRYAGLYSGQPTWTNDGVPYTSATWGMIRTSGPSGGFTISDFGSNYWFAESQAEYPTADLVWTIPGGSAGIGDPVLAFDSWWPIAGAIGQVLKLPPAVMYNPPRIYTAIRAGAGSTEWKEISALVQFQAGTPISWGSTPGQTIQEMTRVVRTTDTSFILGPEDTGTIIETLADTQINVTMPETDPGEGWSCGFIQGGDGQITFLQGSANPIKSFLGLVSTAGNNAQATILRTDLNTYNLGGNLS